MVDNTLQVAAKALIVNDGGQVLILREPETNNPGSQSGRYGLVGGRLMPGESYEDAMYREVYEETGLKVDILYPIFVGEWWPIVEGQKIHVIAIFSVCRARSSEVSLSTEHDDFQWINPADAPKYPFMPPDDKVVERYANWGKRSLS